MLRPLALLALSSASLFAATAARPSSLPQNAARVALVDLDGDGAEELVEAASDEYAVRIVSVRGLLGAREFSFPVPARILHVTTLDWQGDGVREIGLLTTAGLLVYALDGSSVAALLAPLERGVLVPFEEPGFPGHRALAMVESAGASGALLLLVDGLGTRTVLGRVAPGESVRLIAAGDAEREIARLRYRSGGAFGVGPAPLTGGSQEEGAGAGQLEGRQVEDTLIVVPDAAPLEPLAPQSPDAPPDRP